MNNESVSLKNSVAASLIKNVFGIYFIITIIVTAIQLTIEYFHVKESIRADIGTMENTFGTGLANALWDYNTDQLQSVIFGMNELSVVTGVKIDDERGSERGAIGIILSGDEQVLVTSDGQHVSSSYDSSFTPLSGLFFHNFDIEYYHEARDETVLVGKATIYSASKVIIDRIKYGFYLIIINSVIKTAALWFIIFYFVRIIIGRPLAILTETTVKMNPGHPDFSNIRYSSEEKRLLRSENELGLLTRSFDKMRNAILERIDNLQRLRNIGEKLSGINEINFTFKHIMETMEEKFAFKKGTLFLREGQDIFKMASAHPDMELSCAENKSFRVGVGILGKAAEKGEILYLSNIHAAPEPTANSQQPTTASSESLLCIPLTDGNILSGMMNFSENRGSFGLTDENRIFLEAVARLMAINIKNIQMLKMMEEHVRLTQEMDIARKIQTVLLPKKPEITGYEIAAIMEPCEHVGGDYYDVISVGGYDWIIIGDVSGHGVAAGLIMMMVQTSIHTVLNENPEVPPSRLLSVINKSIYSNIEKMGESKHMTIVVLASGKDGKFSFSGLHEDILIRRSKTGKIEKIESGGMWIGLEPDISGFLSDDTLRLEPGDCMVLFTDGITEAVCEMGELFGNEHLIEIVEKNGKKSATEIRQSIISALEPCEKADDVTLVVMKRV